MVTYINKNVDNIYVEFPEELDPKNHQIGSTYTDYRAGLWVLLSAEQLLFRQDNPNANVKEVLDMQLTIIPPAPEPTPEEKRQRAYMNKLSLIDQQDKATETFTLNGISMWLDKETRSSLMGSTIPAAKASGATEITLWYSAEPPVAVNTPIDWIEGKLAELEMYAKDTYDTTQKHKAAVYALTTAEEIEAYDHTAGYPAVKTFTL